MAAFAAGFPLVTRARHPRRVQLLVRHVEHDLAAAAQRILGAGEGGHASVPQHELFDPIGMSNVRADFDDAGTFVASSYVYATPRDYARFGLLYLRDGVWDGQAHRCRKVGSTTDGRRSLAR